MPSLIAYRKVSDAITTHQLKLPTPEKHGTQTGQELATATGYGAKKLLSIVVDNGTYGTIRAHQERNYPERVSGTTLENPDFTGLAKAYGFHAERVERTEDFPAAFARARASRTGAVLDLNISAEALTPRQTLSQMRATALAAKGRK